MSHEKEGAVYTAIYEKLRQKIFFGQFKPGDLLPSENQLCTEFHASRETVRKGLKNLANEHLIYAKAKVGYFVAQPNHREFTMTYSPMLEACSANYLDIHGIQPDSLLQQKLDIDADRKVIEITQGYFNEAGEMAAIEIKYIPYVRAYPTVEGEIRYAVLPDITFSKLSTYEYYSEIQVSAVLATSDLAQKLQCDTGEPLLLTERTIFHQDGSRAAYCRAYGKAGYGMLQGTSGQRI